MPKIDWTPGLGRRGRPLRRVLGMGQRQGLIVLSGLAAVIVLLAVISAFGGFDSSGDSGGAGAAGRSGTNADSDNAGDADAAAGADGLKGSAEAAKVLSDSVRHYTDMFAGGQKIVGATRYPDMAAYGKAFLDPKSPAAELSAFRMSSKPESDTSYLAAAGKAGAAYGRHRSALNQWSRDMEQAKEDLESWVATAVQYQQGAAPQADLDAAAASVTRDLEKAQADVPAVVS